jgi:hypothetical protein
MVMATVWHTALEEEERMQGIADLPQPVWGYIFIVLLVVLLIALVLNDPRTDDWLRRFRHWPLLGSRQSKRPERD